MEITRQADYAVRAVLYLAQLGPHSRVSTAQIAREQKIPATFLAKIMSQLSASGIVHATRGAHGGVRLARPADEVSLLEVVEAIDGAILLNDCVANPEACPLSSDCPIQRVWCQAQTDLLKRLRETRFGALVEEARPPTVMSLISV
jgi:Rrf2 family protein